MSTSGRGTPPRYDLIDRTPQNLPVGVGGFDVVRERHRTSATTKWLRRNVPRLMIAAGVLGAVFGAYLTITQPPTPVYLEGNAIHIAGNVLKVQSESATQETFVGSGAMVLNEN